MALCPVCGSNLAVVKYRWLTNVIGLTKPHFVCPACNWKMTIAEVHKRGSIEAIAREKTFGNRSGERNIRKDWKPRHKRKGKQRFKRRFHKRR